MVVGRLLRSPTSPFTATATESHFDKNGRVMQKRFTSLRPVQVRDLTSESLSRLTTNCRTEYADRTLPCARGRGHPPWRAVHGNCFERFVIAHVRLPLGTSLYCIISCSCWSWLVALALRFCVDVREFPARILGHLRKSGRNSSLIPVRHRGIPPARKQRP